MIGLEYDRGDQGNVKLTFWRLGNDGSRSPVWTHVGPEGSFTKLPDEHQYLVDYDFSYELEDADGS